MKTPQIADLEPDPELFEPGQFQHLADVTGSLPKTIKEAVRRGDKVLYERFLARQNIKLIVRRRAWLIDQVMIRLWRQFSFSQADHICLLAVGGYGRAEMHPHSDIDLLILVQDDAVAEQYHDEIETLITQLWDTGLAIGHSVRTLQQCTELAAQDITVATNIMEARHIAGDPTMGHRMLDLTSSDQVWSLKAFYIAKCKEQQARHAKFDHTEFKLEPDIKNAPGGLRDLQTIGWVTKRYFDANRLSDLMQHDFLTEDEYRILNSCQRYLWRLRFALHVISGRSENRLLFDHQKAVADLLGYRDSNVNLAVETMMQRYYRVAITVAQFNDMLLQDFDEKILRARETVTITKLNDRFQLRNNYIEVTHPGVFNQTPSALLEIFVILAQQEQIRGIRASTIRRLRDSRDLIDQKFRNDRVNINYFMTLLRSPNKIYTQLYQMKRYGILGSYIPEFGRVVGQMQFDLFHVYTVDAHALHVVRHLRMFRHAERKQDFPICHAIVHRIPKVELLYIAGLFHDLAKGRGGDHSELGAVDAYNFCKHHQLSNWDAKLVSWLVEQHLLMSMTAQKKDVSDPDVIHEFATIVEDQIRLDYLFALTVADICSTNEELWNGWRSTLMRQLYAETRRALSRGLENPTNRQEWIEETRGKALNILTGRGHSEASISNVWRHLDNDYFQRESFMDVARHTAAIINHGSNDEPLIVIGKTDERSYRQVAEIFIYTKDTPNLFAVTVAALNQLSLSIVDAKIITSSNHYSLDTYIVLDENGANIYDDKDRIEQIKTTLIETLLDPSRYPDIVQKRMPRALKNFNIPTQVMISNNIQRECTQIEVIALDQPGLLAEIGCIFLEYNLLVQNARIATLGERVEDVFYITDANGEMIKNPQLCAALKQSITETLDNRQGHNES